MSTNTMSNISSASGTTNTRPASKRRSDPDGTDGTNPFLAVMNQTPGLNNKPPVSSEKQEETRSQNKADATPSATKSAAAQKNNTATDSAGKTDADNQAPADQDKSQPAADPKPTTDDAKSLDSSTPTMDANKDNNFAVSVASVNADAPQPGVQVTTTPTINLLGSAVLSGKNQPGIGQDPNQPDTSGNKPSASPLTPLSGTDQPAVAVAALTAGSSFSDQKESGGTGSNGKNNHDRNLPPDTIIGPHSSVTTAKIGEGQTAVAPRAAQPSESFDQTLRLYHSGNSVAVTLEPDGMGKMNINLSMSHGSLHARVQVADETVRNLIGNNVQTIVDSLSRQGLSVGGFSVSLRNGGQGNGRADNAYVPAERTAEGLAANGTDPPSTEVNRVVSIFI